MKADQTNFVSLIRRGREEGILYVIDVYGAYLQAIVRRRLFSVPYLVDDCMNDIFFGIWKNIDSFDEAKGSFQGWAAAVARLKAIDYLRRAARDLKTVSLDELEWELLQEDAALAAILERELSGELKELLSNLNEKDQELFWRVYAEQEEPEQAGARLGITKNNVYVRLFRGKKKLRKLAEQRKEIGRWD